TLALLCHKIATSNFIEADCQILLLNQCVLLISNGKIQKSVFSDIKLPQRNLESSISTDKKYIKDSIMRFLQ
ncbi:MAG: hypothetical protein KHY79_09575, partial [Clostridiales bacterium]|nr:hypothetical protein [Clostridiales bacterium]